MRRACTTVRVRTYINLYSCILFSKPQFVTSSHIDPSIGSTTFTLFDFVEWQQVPWWCCCCLLLLLLLTIKWCGWSIQNTYIHKIISNSNYSRRAIWDDKISDGSQQCVVLSAHNSKFIFLNKLFRFLMSDICLVRSLFYYLLCVHVWCICVRVRCSFARFPSSIQTNMCKEMSLGCVINVARRWRRLLLTNFMCVCVCLWISHIQLYIHIDTIYVASSNNNCLSLPVQLLHKFCWP